jgi:hypothetical protein
MASEPNRRADIVLLHLQAAPDTGHRHLRGGLSAARVPAAATAAQGPALGSVPSGAAAAPAREEISSSGREGARRRLAAALAHNTTLVASGADATAVAADVEAGVLDAAGTRCTATHDSKAC